MKLKSEKKSPSAVMTEGDSKESNIMLILWTVQREKENSDTCGGREWFEIHHTHFIILTSSVIVYAGKRGVHHGLQQIPALPARHTRGARPQIPRGYRPAARKEEQVEELKSVKTIELWPSLILLPISNYVTIRCLFCSWSHFLLGIWPPVGNLFITLILAPFDPSSLQPYGGR